MEELRIAFDYNHAFEAAKLIPKIVEFLGGSIQRDPEYEGTSSYGFIVRKEEGNGRGEQRAAAAGGR